MAKFKRITASYYEVTGDATATIRRTAKEDLELIFPTGNQFAFREEAFESICVDALSNPFPDWKELFGLKATIWPPPDGTLRTGKTEDMQLVSSLIHLAYEVFKAERNNLNYKVLLGKPLYDLLPPKNKLIIPSAAMQQDLAKLAPNTFYVLGRLFRCEIQFTEIPESFYYRPYNTPIVKASQLAPVEDLSRRLSNEYQEILNVLG
ncbi:MAG: hypothetical protein M0033_10880 [Nitrospiraceae bacterium]|nr:hypothetical protein [Nitrospiraceae bacterium]